MFLSLQRGFSPYLHSLLDDLNRLIGPIFLVGGGLRCALQHKPPPDELNILAPQGLPHCRRKLLDAGYAMAVMGSRHNSLLLPLKRQENPKLVEISTFRHRPSHPATVEEDLSHRDITANAMAFGWPDGPFIDPFGGREDLSRNCIRLVNGAATLHGEPLRALRFFRFTLQLGGQPDPDDLRTAQQTNPGPIAQEQIRAEIDQIFSLPLRDAFSRELVHRLFDSELGARLFPELNQLRDVPEIPGQPESAWQTVMRMVLAITSPSMEEEVSFLDLRWTALLHETGKIRCAQKDTAGHIIAFPGLREETMRLNAEILSRLQFSKRRQRRINLLVQYLDTPPLPGDRALRKLIEQNIPVEGLFRLIRAKREALGKPAPIGSRPGAGEEFARAMRRCHLTRESLKRLQPCDLALSGGEILDMVRMEPGPWLGKLRNQLVEWIGHDPYRNQRELLAHQVREWIAKQAEL